MLLIHYLEKIKRIILFTIHIVMLYEVEEDDKNIYKRSIYDIWKDRFFNYKIINHLLYRFMVLGCFKSKTLDVLELLVDFFFCELYNI